VVRPGRVAHRQREAAAGSLPRRDRGDDLQPDGIGERFEHVRELELVGAALTLVALVANNVLTRRPQRRAHDQEDSAPAWEPAEAA
jgi:hypothetical protein